MHQMYVDEIREKLNSFKTAVDAHLCQEIHREAELAEAWAFKRLPDDKYNLEKSKKITRKLEAIQGGLAPIKLLVNELEENDMQKGDE